MCFQFGDRQTPSRHHLPAGEPPAQPAGGRGPVAAVNVRWAGPDLARPEFQEQPGLYTDLLSQAQTSAVSQVWLQPVRIACGAASLGPQTHVTNPRGVWESCCPRSESPWSLVVSCGLWKPASSQGRSCRAALPAPGTSAGALAGQRGPFLSDVAARSSGDVRPPQLSCL